jgi:uncharacterized membrane protein
MIATQPLTIISISTGGIFFLAGLYLNRFPSKKINPLFGYRTRASMHNQERWDFSQPFAGRMLALAGIVSSLIGVLAMFVSMSENWSVGLGIGLVIVNAIWPILSTENELRKRFGKL